MKLSDNIKQWYKSAYPTDDIVEDISEKVKFEDVVLCLENGMDVYDFIAPDSLCRERVFVRLTEITGKPYDHFYQQWLNS